MIARDAADTIPSVPNRHCRVLTLVTLTCMTAAPIGCGGGANFELPSHHARRSSARVDRTQLTRGGIGIPADAPFNIAHPNSSNDGGGQAAASAEPDGRASCRAAVAGAGSATAEFLLGHKFDIGSGDGLDVLIQIDAAGTYRHSAAGEQTPEAAAELWAFVKDTNGVMLRREALFAGTGDVAERSFQQIVQFEIKLGGDVGYYVMLVGRATATGIEDCRAEAELSLRSASLSMRPRP
ncbi:MAG: hypothetical protein HUU22_13760 [Phycisphaerae bacterium]|nr:hypothetical protein [Phycisphaerae bacterium]NUQ47086.1 hypothetical protein [Phycisphaerae bacterium]